MLQPVIIAGGTGSRLWPVSRQLYPKQFLSLTGRLSMLQLTAERLSPLKHNPPIVVCNEEHRFIAAEQLRQIDVEHNGIILEPVGRNTAPAICLAAMRAQELDPDATLLVLPADHHIPNVAEFCAVIERSLETAENGKLVTFGIQPNRPATGFGYIKAQTIIPDKPSKVLEFVEKPTHELALSYVQSGEYLWNSGIFLFSAKSFLAELQQFRPDIFGACQSAWKAKENDLEFIRIDQGSFEACPSESIDYAVMEKTDKAFVMPMGVDWSDVGSWSALFDVLPKSDTGNVQKGDVICVQSSNNYVYSEGRLLTTLGIENLVIVDTKDALLVAHKDKVEDVKQIVEKIKQDKRHEYIHHREVYRPWGKYDSMDSGERFQVKRITVKPQAKLSLQKHHHRSEHWVVVSGTAKVRVGDEEKLVSENESVYIPIGTLHSLENPGKIPLELIEVQSGSYLGEDDIIRLEDRYGRS